MCSNKCMSCFKNAFHWLFSGYEGAFLFDLNMLTVKNCCKRNGHILIVTCSFSSKQCILGKICHFRESSLQLYIVNKQCSKSTHRGCVSITPAYTVIHYSLHECTNELRVNLDTNEQLLLTSRITNRKRNKTNKRLQPTSATALEEIT